MNIGLTLCILLCALFLLLAIIFGVSKNRGAVLISGFNDLPKQEQDKYDKAKMSKDMRNSLCIWSAIFAIGAILCYFITSYFAILAFVIWLFIFFRHVHFDAEKAFEKYRFKKKSN